MIAQADSPELFEREGCLRWQTGTEGDDQEEDREVDDKTADSFKKSHDVCTKFSAS